MFNKNWIRGVSDLNKFAETLKSDGGKLITRGFYEVVKECKEHHGLISKKKFNSIMEAMKRTGE